MKKARGDSTISLLIIDDSLPFRWVLQGIFDRHPRIRIVGEASNGIQGLDLVLKLKPDVIIMDMEMPLMDGMTALQHLMIHTPTPTIMFSSLTKEGTTRSFDALKSGAVDFVCKDFLFQGKIIEAIKDSIIDKVLNASHVTMKSIEPFFADGAVRYMRPLTEPKVVFCEECGRKAVINISNDFEIHEIICTRCGERIELDAGNKYRRNNFITFIGAGEGGFANLLKIIPKFDADMSGSIVIQIYDDSKHIDSFTEYLDSISSMRVIRIQDGLILEGGNCYVASYGENISLKPYSAHYTLRCGQAFNAELDPFASAMVSISSIFKDHVAGIVLSGNEPDGVEGFRAIKKGKGSIFVLDPRSCLYQGLSENIIRQCSPKILRDEDEIVKRIESLHLKAKETILTA